MGSQDLVYENAAFGCKVKRQVIENNCQLSLIGTFDHNLVKDFRQLIAVESSREICLNLAQAHISDNFLGLLIALKFEFAKKQRKFYLSELSTQAHDFLQEMNILDFLKEKSPELPTNKKPI